MGILAIIAKPPSGAGATNDIRAIRPPVEIPWGWMWLVWLLVVLALLALAWWYWSYRQQHPRVAPELKIPKVSPRVRALNRLDAALALLDQPDAFVVAVSSALREYIEERFEFRAPERTTEEFLFELRGTDLLNEEQKQGLAGFLSQCDLVKFARFDPGVAELRQLHQAAVDFVEQTHAQPELKPEEVRS